MRTIQGHLENSITNPAPTMECYIPSPEKSNGVGIVILPGGGYNVLAPHEGQGYAEFLVRHGFTCFVTSYRLCSAGFKHPAMIEDALAAITAARSRADEFHLDPAKIGVMGSSAGGHLSAHAMVAWGDYNGILSARPDFGILCYPVITTTSPYSHRCLNNLCGEDVSQRVMDDLSCEKRVNKQTPPCFIWHTIEDTNVSVENSLLFATALRTHSIPFELHLYEKGPHGLGLGAPFSWGDECVRWLGRFSR